MSNTLSMWVIFDTNTRDFPGVFVCRRNEIGAGWVRPTDDHFTGNSLEEMRQRIPPGKVCIPRYPEDDPNIIEVWL